MRVSGSAVDGMDWMDGVAELKLGDPAMEAAMMLSMMASTSAVLSASQRQPAASVA